MSNDQQAEYTFTVSGQLRFADLSGDFNPIHSDPVAARREMTGGVVAHGVHVLFRLLEYYLGFLERQGTSWIEIKKLSCRFRKPVYLDRKIHFRLVQGRDVAVRLDACDGCQVLISCKLEWSPFSGCPKGSHPEFEKGSWPTVPDTRSLEEMRGMRGYTLLWVGGPRGDADFPRIFSMIGVRFIADMLGITRVVGMTVPGLRSMLASLDLEPVPHIHGDRLVYKVVEVDERIAMVRLNITGSSLRGNVEAFVRSEPQKQVCYADLLKCIESDEFRGQRALIIGGSRGLGEVTAKVVAAGGGEVLITYNVGEEEALAVCDEINRGGGRANRLKYDALVSSQDICALGQDFFDRTHVYYFATPRLSRSTGTFDESLFAAYADYYVKGFANLCDAFAARKNTSSHFLFPSTVAIEEGVADLREYICAKAAGEALCHHYGKNQHRVRIYTRRFPMMATDLTHSLIPVEMVNAVDYLLPVIRDLHAGRTPRD